MGDPRTLSRGACCDVSQRPYRKRDMAGGSQQLVGGNTTTASGDQRPPIGSRKSGIQVYRRRSIEDRK